MWMRDRKSNRICGRMQVGFEGGIKGNGGGESGLGQPVAHSGLGENELWPAGIRLDLAPQVPDVDPAGRVNENERGCSRN